MVTKGLFTAVLDFGPGAFNGNARWLEITVICPGEPIVTLSPRTRLRPTPYALALPGLWTQQNDTSPNLIGGYSDNQVFALARGATIGGGGRSGDSNVITDHFGTVSGGVNNRAGNSNNNPEDATYASVGGGVANTASASSATVGGGVGNFASARSATVGGGEQNTASDSRSTVGGGVGNAASAISATVGGGFSNIARGEFSTAGGGRLNAASGISSTIGGGEANAATASHATVGGGFDNRARTAFAAIGGGGPLLEGPIVPVVTGGSRDGIPTAANESVAAAGAEGNLLLGTGNRVTDDYGTVSGGGDNQAGDNAGATDNVCFATVGGGRSNTASGVESTVGGGVGNTASANSATVGGGFSNTASGEFSTAGGGQQNSASSEFSTVGGGQFNFVFDDYGTVGGGQNNTAGTPSFVTDDNAGATVGGGRNNTAGAFYSTVGGGRNNEATGWYTAIGGGNRNKALAYAAMVPGGWDCTAEGERSFAAGRRAHAIRRGSFVWADDTAENSDLTFASTRNHQFNVKAAGGTRIFSNAAATVGVCVAPGGNSWSVCSDRALKENFAPVDGRQVLEKLSRVPITRWNLKSQDASISHIGPMAQDFHSAFGLGDSDRHISTSDADGIAFGAIQGLHKMIREKNGEVETLRSENTAIRARLEALEMLVAELAEPQKGGN